MKNHVHALVAALSARESELVTTEFLAPVVRGGRIRLRVAGLVHPCAVSPSTFSGWGVFVLERAGHARLVRRADHASIRGYLDRLPLRRVRLAQRLARGSHAAIPLHGSTTMVQVHLTHGAQVMDVVHCRFDGNAHWFEDVDRTEDPRLSERLRTELTRGTAADMLKMPGVTTEARVAYALALPHAAERTSPTQARLMRALQKGGGALEGFTEDHHVLEVRWRDRHGHPRVSTVMRGDLTVVSSGICLSGMDRDFDLASLVGVMAGEDG